MTNYIDFVVAASKDKALAKEFAKRLISQLLKNCRIGINPKVSLYLKKNQRN